MVRRAAFPLLILLSYCASLSFAEHSDPFCRTFQLTYEVHLDPSVSPARELQMWIPLAASDRHQTILKRTIEVAYPYQVVRDPEYGNSILFLQLEGPLPKRLDLSIRYEAVVCQEIVLKGPAHPVLNQDEAPPRGGTSLDRNLDEVDQRQIELNLKSNRLMVVNDQIRELALSITQGTSTPLEQAQAIYRYVIERMSYEKEMPGWGHGDTLRACLVGAGNCTDFHSLFISLSRAVGIPARFRIGTPVPLSSEGEIPGYHCWAEFYLKGVGWVPVDASEAWKDRKRLDEFFGTHDPNRLAFTTGRDIQLIPKPANGSVNIFIFPYAEVDGKAFDRIETRFWFRELDQGSNQERRLHA